MKKLMLILLLALLPLQASWGVVSAYAVQAHETCPPACSQELEPQAKDDHKHNSKHVAVHHDDRFCGLHAFGIIETCVPQDIPLASFIAPQADQPRSIGQALIERPERPKWVASA
jgi:hypothetical protein